MCRDMPAYAHKSRQDVEIDTPDHMRPWKLPEPAPLRASGPLIQMEAVTFAYPGASKQILTDITLCIEQVSFSSYYPYHVPPHASATFPTCPHRISQVNMHAVTE